MLCCCTVYTHLYTHDDGRLIMWITKPSTSPSITWAPCPNSCAVILYPVQSIYNFPAKKGAQTPTPPQTSIIWKSLGGGSYVFLNFQKGPPTLIRCSAQPLSLLLDPVCVLAVQPEGTLLLSHLSSPRLAQAETKRTVGICSQRNQNRTDNNNRGCEFVDHLQQQQMQRKLQP